MSDTVLAQTAYLLPIRRTAVPADDDLPAYLARLVHWVSDVVVVDGSPPEIFAAFHAQLPAEVRHLRVDPRERGSNGKVNGVRTGMRAIRAPRVIVADDDVRYEPLQLRLVAAALGRAEIALPQNVFAPLPWHALLDTGRTLIARATGGDWPGTLAIRRAAFVRAGAYDADVLFENLELVRTIRAAGGRVARLDDAFVLRRPPTAAHFRSQRARQAYDEFARPLRLAIQLAIAPAAFASAVRFGWRGPLAIAGAAVALAEAGRQRANGTRVFPLLASLCAPAWVAERAVTSWIALLLRAQGGVRYSHGRLRVAAHSERALRGRVAG